MKSLSLVAADSIPAGETVPTDNLLAIFKICTQMEQFCVKNQGVGLAAVQLGIPWNLFVVFFNGAKPHFRYFINCSYKGIEPKIQSMEGCLSLKTAEGKLRHFEVLRFSRINLIGHELIINESGLELVSINKEFSGLHAVVCQHEIDHSAQILISEIGKEINILE